MRNKKLLFRVRPLKKRRHRAKPAEKKPFLSHGIKLALKYTGVAVLTVLLTFLVYFKEQAGEWFKASVLEAPQPFNGTVMPVDKVPNWVRWDGDHITSHYLSIPEDKLIPLPAYDLNVLAIPTESLVWRNPAQDYIYNAKLTYPVVYLGTYQNDHIEGRGSHLAVDIKMPKGTPVKAIANGKVVKMTMEESGFGHHIVIKHVQVPDPENPGRFTTLYSGYNHLGDVRVVEGQNVLKGEQIGTSGNTGTSTTPHLHLQIDKDTAPWHPYWPFTWQESQDAGLSFFEAVNAGLGLSKARANTVNPMLFINQNLNYSMVASSDPTDVTPPPVDDTPVITPPVDTEDPVVVVDLPDERIDTSLFAFKVTGETVTLVGSGITLTVQDENHQVEQLGEADRIEVKVEGPAKPLQASLGKTDFNNGMAKVILRSDEPGESVVAIGKSSHKISFIDKVETASSLAFEHDGYFQKNIVETVKILAVDSSGNPVPAINFSGQVAVTVEEGQATITPNRLELRDFDNGVATIRVKIPNEERVVLKAQNGALVGKSDALQNESSVLFTDIGRSHSNYDAIKYLKEQNIIGGYPDGSFKPEQTVNRVEALKMLMLAFDVEAGVAGPLPFSDTDNSAWYATTLATAVEKGIVKGYDDGRFRPAQTVNRAEYLKILFNSSGTEFTGGLLSKPYNDVERTDWFARYAYLANQKNLLDVAGNLLQPANGMTRADVAETIYRMKMIEEKGLLSYSQ
ncbi:MAG: S-layer homology domain-containing protein [Candidatus Peregrinibacteria bacterium]